MHTPDPISRLDSLLGPPRSRAEVVALGPERCRALVDLVLDQAPAARVRPEPWSASTTGLTLCFGSDFGVGLGLDFPAWGAAGPDGGWVRSARPGGAVHWRIGRPDAARILALLRRAMRARRSTRG